MSITLPCVTGCEGIGTEKKPCQEKNEEFPHDRSGEGSRELEGNSGDIHEQACQVGSGTLSRDFPNIYSASSLSTCHAIQFGPAPVTIAACTSPCPDRGPAS